MRNSGDKLEKDQDPGAVVTDWLPRLASSLYGIKTRDNKCVFLGQSGLGGLCTGNVMVSIWLPVKVLISSKSREIFGRYRTIWVLHKNDWVCANYVRFEFQFYPRMQCSISIIAW